MNHLGAEEMVRQLAEGARTWRGFSKECHAIETLLVTEGLAVLVSAERSPNGLRQYDLTDAGINQYKIRKSLK